MFCKPNRKPPVCFFANGRLFNYRFSANVLNQSAGLIVLCTADAGLVNLEDLPDNPNYLIDECSEACAVAETGVCSVVKVHCHIAALALAVTVKIHVILHRYLLLSNKYIAAKRAMASGGLADACAGCFNSVVCNTVVTALGNGLNLPRLAAIAVSSLRAFLNAGSFLCNFPIAVVMTDFSNGFGLGVSLITFRTAGGAGAYSHAVGIAGRRGNNYPLAVGMSKLRKFNILALILLKAAAVNAVVSL